MAEEDDLDGIDPDDPLHASTPAAGKKKHIGHDWGAGYVAPWWATSVSVVAAVNDELRLVAEDVVVDLGSGDGRVVIQAARAAGCRAEGIELDAGLVGRARAEAVAAGVDHLVAFRQLDFMSDDFSMSDYTVIFVYLLPETLRKLAPRFRSLLESPSRLRAVVSSRWPIGGLEDFLSPCRACSEEAAPVQLQLPQSSPTPRRSCEQLRQRMEALERAWGAKGFYLYQCPVNLRP
eukprot:tig00001214_g7551.t1